MTRLFALLYCLHRLLNVPICTEQQLSAMICRHAQGISYVCSEKEDHGERSLFLSPRSDNWIIHHSFRPIITIRFHKAYTGVVEAFCEVSHETLGFLKVYNVIMFGLEVLLFASLFMPQPQMTAFLAVLGVHLLYLAATSIVFRLTAIKILKELTGS